jgi:hypothetical protein
MCYVYTLPQTHGEQLQEVKRGEDWNWVQAVLLLLCWKDTSWMDFVLKDIYSEVKQLRLAWLALPLDQSCNTLNCRACLQHRPPHPLIQTKGDGDGEQLGKICR